MQYKVTVHYPRNEERPCAQFQDKKDANFFVEKRWEEALALKTAVVYRIYKGDVLEFDTSTEKPPATEQGGQGKDQTAGFRPTPFATAPAPRGAMAQKWGTVKKDDDENKT